MRHGSRRTYQRRKQRRMQQRGAPRSSVSVGPGSAGATGSHRDRRRCARGGCSRPGAPAVAHGGLEAVGRHSQAQLWRRGATSRSRPRLCPADLLAGSPVVSTSRSCVQRGAAQHRARGARWAASRCYVHGIARASREPGVVTDPQRAKLGPAARPRRALGGPGGAARLRTRTGGSAGHGKCRKIGAQNEPPPRRDPLAGA